MSKLSRQLPHAVNGWRRNPMPANLIHGTVVSAQHGLAIRLLHVCPKSWMMDATSQLALATCQGGTLVVGTIGESSSKTF